jgi:coproporphyrinogen III oxidase-like Fe-S oxidoreductase
MEPNTVFAKYPPQLPSDDESADIQDMILETMAGAGYEHYEVSAYAKPGHRARHNLNYWEFGDYLGIGAGAHSKLSFPHRVLRQARYKQPGSFIEAAEGQCGGGGVRDRARRHGLRVHAEYAAPDRKASIRTCSGSAPGCRSRRSRRGWTRRRKGLLYRDFKVIRPTELGQRFLNDLQEMFLAG